MIGYVARKGIQSTKTPIVTILLNTRQRLYSSFKSSLSIEFSKARERLYETTAALVEELRRSKSNPSDAAQPTKLYISHLPKGTTNEELEDIVGRYKPTSIIIRPRRNDLSLFAFLTFASPEDAVGVLSAQAQELFRARDEIIVLSLPAPPRKALASNDSEEAPPNNRIYVAPVPTNATQEDVRKVFKRWGAIEWVHLGRSSESTKHASESSSISAAPPKSHAFVTFATLESARAARDCIGNDWLATDDAEESVSVLGMRTRAWYAARSEGDSVKSKRSQRRK